MYSEHARTALMYVDYGGDAYAGMGIKAMKSFARPRGMEPSKRPLYAAFFSLFFFFFHSRKFSRFYHRFFSISAVFVKDVSFFFSFLFFFCVTSVQSNGLFFERGKKSLSETWFYYGFLWSFERDTPRFSLLSLLSIVTSLTLEESEIFYETRLWKCCVFGEV